MFKIYLYRVYFWKFGTDYNFIDKNYTPMVELKYLYDYDPSENWIVLNYINKNGQYWIGAFSSKPEFIVENTFEIYQPWFTVYSPNLNQILAISDIELSGPVITIFGGNIEAITTIEWKEDTLIRFSPPIILLVKGIKFCNIHIGGLEMIAYDVSTQKFSHLKLPCPVIATEKDPNNSIELFMLLDLGRHFVFAESRIYSDKASIIFYLNQISKSDLPNDKLISIMYYDQSEYSPEEDRANNNAYNTQDILDFELAEKPTEESVALHFRNSVQCHSLIQTK